MARKLSKTKKKRLVVFGTISLIIIGYFFFSLGYNLYRLHSLKKEEVELKETLTELKRESKILNAEITKFNDPEYIADYARKYFSYSKGNEKIIKIPEKEKEKKEEEKFELNIDYNYIIYGGAALIFIIFIYAIVKKK